MEQATTARQRIDRILSVLDPSEVGAPRAALEEFARRLLVRAGGEALGEWSVERALAELYALYRLTEKTPPGEINARVRLLREGPNRAVLETVMPDCAFIVNTLKEALHSHGCDIHHLLHPVFVLERDAAGRILEVKERTAEGHRTSVVYAAIEGFLDEEERRALEREVCSRLAQVQQATRDYRGMVGRAQEISRELKLQQEEVSWRAGELEEVQDLLQWLEEDNFVFLGYRAYRFDRDEGRQWVQLENGSSLGILRDESRSRYYERRAMEELSPELRARVLGGPLLIISKTNAESPIHRREPMDYIGIKRMDAGGEVRGEHRFLGLFTANALQQDASTIPILRRKLREILEAEGAAKGSHDYNLILQLFNSMPKEELFLSTVPELAQVIETVMEVEGADEVRVTAHPDPLSRGVNALVILPRHRFSDDVREKVQEALVREYRGSVLNYHLALDEGDQVRLHYYIATELAEPGGVDLEELESHVRESVRSWEERLSAALERTRSPEEAQELAQRHLGDFSAEYKAVTDVGTAVRDVERLESLESTGVQQVVMEGIDTERPHTSRLKVFAPRGRFVLSDVMPTLENLGFRVIEAEKYDVGEGGRASTIHTFQVETPAEWRVDRKQAETRVGDALRAVQEAWAEDDRLNSLVLSAGLDWREVAVLRAYAAYAVRIDAAVRSGIQRSLTKHPRPARLLYELFEAALDPGREEGRAARVRRRRAAFHDSLRAVDSIEDDRTFRRLLGLVGATLRTNFFRARSVVGPLAVALKFDGTRIEVMPEPRPRYEVYLNGPRTEAAHLRMGPVARGGIRWSDRIEDFRDEVLGLVKTQQAKNAVIVPEGAKGAFIVKRRRGDPEDSAAAVVASYREFIGTLLDLTDNVVDGEVRHPSGLVVRDGEDPYLVVAADKGTARLSDTANELARERGFWLDDAFASGGSRGYDHKALGITARGAWECVKRHFWELGKDVQREEFTVVGIGDMSGDVFGNGLLQSRRIKLVAAFDHRHIFVDPDPDPEASFGERRRLFELPGSCWADYDLRLLSAGGGVFERGAKEIPLSREARERLGVPEEERELNGEVLIRHILRAPVDLLWNGGIGTYVKADEERDGDVMDPGNDAVRLNAPEVRARVIGEGGNLGLTQRARVQYALHGGRLNTDALDNSAGVDMSDHEVNLKILLGDAVSAGLLDAEARDHLLFEVTDEVADAVLADNYTQSLAVSLDEHRVRRNPASFRDALAALEAESGLDRSRECLPTAEELLERGERGAHLTRPELAVILAHAKMHLKRGILASDLPGDPAFATLLEGYFPARTLGRLGDRVEELLRAHRLRPHIIATVLANRFVDRMGGAAHLQLARETGREAVEVARMWYIAGCLGGVDEILRALRETDGRVPAGVQYQWHLEIARALERATLWLLAKSDPGVSTSECVERFRGPVTELRAALPGLLHGESGKALEERRALYETDGLSGEVAVRLATFCQLDELLPVALLARQTGIRAPLAGAVYFGISEAIDFPWLQAQLARLADRESWARRAAKTLSLELQMARERISREILGAMDEAPGGTAAQVGKGEGGAAPGEKGGVDAAARDVLAAFRTRERARLRRICEVVEAVRAEPEPDLAAVLVAVHAIAGASLPTSGH